MKKILAFSIVLFAFATGAFAQSASATATATAVIFAPITLTQVADMSFGNIIADADGGTVVLVPAGTRTLNGLLSTPLPGTVTAASFNVSGNINTTYAITLPATHDISNGTQTMTVNAFTSDPTPTGLLDGAGAQTLNVGATLNVNANQAAGTYTNAAGFTVTVNYN